MGDANASRRLGLDTGEVEVKDGNRLLFRVPLTTQRLVIGRSPKAPIRLDRDTVSRQHAELSCDPFGRRWVRDLGSRNGVIVNGVKVSERIVQWGDVLVIGGFTLILARAGVGTSGDGLLSTGSIATPDTTVGRISRLREQPASISAAHLSALMGFCQRLAVIDDPLVRLRALCEQLVDENFHARSAVALRVDTAPGKSGPAQMLCHADFPRAETGQPLYVSRTVLRALLEGGEPVLASNVAMVGSDSNIQLSMAADVMPMAAIACPVRTDARQMDLLYITLPPEFGTNDWLALVSLAVRHYQQSESAWEARRQAEAHAAIERELEYARQIQMRLVPRGVVVPGLDIAIGYEPCRWVGGDYVDVVPMAKGRTLLVVADVCGKGLSAALVASGLHTIVRTATSHCVGLAELLTGADQHLRTYLPEGSFVTMVCAILDPQTGSLSCINAGHPPALLVGSAGNSRPLQWAAHPPLGLELLPRDPAALTVQTETLGPGDLLTMFSDGLTDLQNEEGEFLGLERLAGNLCSAYARVGSGQLQGVVTSLSNQLAQFRGHCLPIDDQTLLMARRVM